MVIASKSYTDDFKQGVKLLAKFPFSTITMIFAKRKAPVGELKLKERLWKNPIIEEVIPPAVEDIEEVGNKRQVKMLILLAKTSNKIYKSQSYNKAINNPIYERRWCETIKDELQNLENNQIWEYNKLSLKQKTISLKYVFKIKYNTNNFVARFKAKLVAQEFSQVPDIDFAKAFLSIVR